jgi:hypothetical protein
MKRRKREEGCWHPCPGSWEEAVVPYDEQCACLKHLTRQPHERPVETATTPPPRTPFIPASL